MDQFFNVDTILESAAKNQKCLFTKLQLLRLQKINLENAKNVFKKAEKQGTKTRKE